VGDSPTPASPPHSVTSRLLRFAFVEQSRILKSLRRGGRRGALATSVDVVGPGVELGEQSLELVVSVVGLDDQDADASDRLGRVAEGLGPPEDDGIAGDRVDRGHLEGDLGESGLTSLEGSLSLAGEDDRAQPIASEDVDGVELVVAHA
jgi:hypothetical protein